MNGTKWNENGDYVRITEDGQVEISTGNTVFVKSIGDWHKTAIDAENQKNQQASLQSYAMNRSELSKAEKIGQYLYMLYEAQKVDHAVHTEIDEALKQYKVELGI